MSPEILTKPEKSIYIWNIYEILHLNVLSTLKKHYKKSCNGLTAFHILRSNSRKWCSDRCEAYDVLFRGSVFKTPYEQFVFKSTSLD